MKNLLIIMLLVVSVPVMALEWGGIFDVNYFMNSVKDDEVMGPDSEYGEVGTAIWATQEIDGMIAKIKLAVSEMSAGRESKSALMVEEVWVSKADPFDVKGLGFKLGKMEVPFNLDYDKGITHCFTNGVAMMSAGIGEIDETWGFTTSYDVEGIGKFSLTTFENVDGYWDDGGTYTDNDTGLFNSMAFQYDTGADAFGVGGLQLVVGFASLAHGYDLDAGSIVSVGAVYELKEVGLTIALEIDSSTDAAQLPSDLITALEAMTTDTYVEGNMDTDGAMLIALNVDYLIPGGDYGVGLSYEMLTYNETDLVFNDGFGDYDLTVDKSTDSRMALNGWMKIGDNSKLRFEYAAISNSEMDEGNTSSIAIGVKGTI